MLASFSKAPSGLGRAMGLWEATFTHPLRFSFSNSVSPFPPHQKQRQNGKPKTKTNTTTHMHATRRTSASICFHPAGHVLGQRWQVCLA